MLQFVFLRITRLEERIRIFCFVKAKSQDWKRHVKQFVFHQQCLQLFWCIFDEIFFQFAFYNSEEKNRRETMIMKILQFGQKNLIHNFLFI